jgi:hypothetical protein
MISWYFPSLFRIFNPVMYFPGNITQNLVIYDDELSRVVGMCDVETRREARLYKIVVL